MAKVLIPHPRRSHATAKKATLQIRFVIVGGGAAGLACAVALRRVGHQVIVLEKDPNFVGASMRRGIRMPPNMTKIFNYWGMSGKIGDIGIAIGRIVMSRLESAYLLGIHPWEYEMLEEAGGEFMGVSHYLLRKLLLETALELGAVARTNAEVVEIAADCRSLRLASGEVIEADVIVGADGARGLCRKIVCPDDPAKGMGTMLFDSVIPGDAVRADPELSSLLQQDQISSWVWFGHERASICFPIGPSQDLALHFYAVDDGAEEGWDDVISSEQFAPYLSGAEPRLQKLGRLACPTRVRMMQRNIPEDWVHDTGRLVLIGSAAHPFPPGIMYGPSMSLEDGSVLAKLFSHLRNEEQIQSFMYAFQNLREARCQSSRAVDITNVEFMMAPSSDETEMRDRMMREKHDQGRNALSGDDEDGTVSQWQHNCEMFGYDAEDEADNWWVQWGLLQERAKAAHREDHSGMDMFALDVNVRIS